MRVTTFDTSKSLDILVACYSRQSVVLRIRVSPPDDQQNPRFDCVEVSRCMLERACVTCMTDIGSDVIVGLDDGACAQLRFTDLPSATIQVKPFVPRAPGASEQRRQGDSTSMVSGMSEDATSHRSVGSSMSLGLMNRLFGTQRALTSSLGAGAAEANSHGVSMPHAFLRRSRDDMASARETADSVLALALVRMEGKVVASLHQSGRVCVYMELESEFQFLSDLELPVKLVKGLANHFLLTGLPESVLAVVMVDEDPSADSLRLFNVTAKLRGERAISLASTQIAKRDGPIDQIVAACFTGDDVIVASETGFVSGILNVSTEIDSSVGIPTGTLWTVLEDVDQSFGLGRALDSAAPMPSDSFLQAHRFSAKTIAKALRLDDMESFTRADVQHNVANTVFEKDPENMWRRVKARAEHICKCEELLVRDMSLIPKVGIIVARNSSLLVFRKLLEAEEKAISNSTRLLSCKEPVANREVAALLASHAACQVIASQYMWNGNEDAEKNELKFMLMLAVSFSHVLTEIPLSNRIALEALRGLDENAQVGDMFTSMVHRAIRTLKPGPPLLSFLNKSSEMQQLLRSSDQVADMLPISAMFASGLAWLSQFRQNGSQPIPSPRELHGEFKPKESSLLVEKAYACLVEAARWCEKDIELAEDDVQCVLNLAGLSEYDAEAAEQGRADDVVMSGEGEGLPNGPTGEQIRQHLGFWLLERSVRLLESSNAPRNAAIVALEAMSRAPDRQRHEMMRAAAFSTFVDAMELEHALTAILREPFSSKEEPHVVKEESDALRDAVGLFVNVAADQGKLQWLADYSLPEPLHDLCGLALERRARAADAMRIDDPSNLQELPADSVGNMQNRKSNKAVGSLCEYEQLYAWHVMRGDESSAATCALEWGERLSHEGLAAIQSFTTGRGRHLDVEEQISLLLSWTKLKCQAFSYASSAAQLEPPQTRFIARSRYAIASGSESSTKGIVSISWASRRHLLAYAQSKVLAEMRSSGDPDVDIKEMVPYLSSPHSNLLADGRDGVAWITGRLAKNASYDKMLLCAELGSAWKEETGDSVLTDVVQTASVLASQRTMSNFGYSHLDDFLRAVVSTEGQEKYSKNWNLVALESALSTTSGAVGVPQWLIDAAAWGTPAFAEGTLEYARNFSGRRMGDAAGVVRTLLRYHRPVEAAKVLLVGLASIDKMARERRDKVRYYVPYSAIDATLELLGEVEDEYEDAETYKKKLEESTRGHMSAMDEVVKESVGGVNVEVMAM